MQLRQNTITGPIKTAMMLSALCIAAQAQAADLPRLWKVKGPSQVYTSKDGKKVTIVPIIPQDGKKFVILQTDGASWGLDGTPIVHEVKNNGKRDDYQHRMTSAGYTTFSVGTNHYGGAPTLYVQGYNKNVQMWLDEKLSEKVDQKDFLNRLLFRREGKTDQKKDESTLKEAATEMNTLCTSDIEASIDWKTFKGADDFDIGHACSTGYAAAQLHCDDDIGKKTFKQFKKLVCKLGKKPALIKSGSSIEFTTAKDAPHQLQFAKEWYENNL